MADQFDTPIRLCVYISQIPEKVLELIGRGTVVRSKESGYPDTPEGPRALLDCATGWGEALALLKFCLEKGVPYTQPE